MGDLFMSLIHTCELNAANPFDYLSELQRHPDELARNPSEWMRWNYRETLAGAGGCRFRVSWDESGRKGSTAARVG